MELEDLRETFKRYDINGDGVLSRHELRNAFYSLGAFIPDWRAFRAIRHADINGDGYIDEAELDNVFSKLIESSDSKKKEQGNRNTFTHKAKQKLRNGIIILLVLIRRNRTYGPSLQFCQNAPHKLD
ncbi:hypothetical protein I3843_16G047000 [Carya illinoinensis]|nr:hypothetical protein I3843_16G047000 [Carya illinoinensis]